VRRLLALLVLIFSSGIVLTHGEEPRDELYRELSTSLTQAEATIAGITLEDDRAITEEQLEALRSLNAQIRGSLYSDLIDRSDLLVLISREQMLLHRDPQQLQVRVEGMLRDSRQEARNMKRSAARDKLMRASFTTTLISFASAFTFWGLGELQDLRYFQATTIEEATLRRRLFQIFSIGSMVGATVGVIGAGVSVTLYASAR
jgi:hypothetical protein